MEFRAYLTIPNLSFQDEARWEPFIQALERDHPELGPVIGWGEAGAEVIIAMDSESEAAAARHGVDAVTQCLRAVGLGDLYPHGVEIELVEDELATA